MLVATSVIGEQRILLQNISWQLFENLLKELGEDRATRLNYERGLLEIMSPLMPHERQKRLIEKLIDILLEELNIDTVSVGSMTCKRQDLELGAEPDTSYYIQNEPLIRGKELIDLTQDPPPDLVLEVEYTKSALNKLQRYTALGVPEFWRYNGKQLLFYHLASGQYILWDNSPTFAPIRTSEITRFLQESKTGGELAMVKSFRAWVRKQLS